MDQTPDTLPGFSADSYGPVMAGSGALKLSQSFVAPLVAVAGGLFSFGADTSVSLADAAARMSMRTQPASKDMKQLSASVGGNDALAMPWTDIDAVRLSAVARSRGHSAIPPAVVAQWRPATPYARAGAKPAKYVINAGAQLTLSVHPATPIDWIDQPAAVLVAEGQLKAYAALTGWLLRCGVSMDSLAQVPDTQVEAITALEALCAAQAPEDRLLIVACVGASTWNNSGLSRLRLKDLAVHVCLDADVRTNRNVWQQAKGLFEYVRSQQGHPDLLALPGASGEKEGVDDYLYAGGTMPQLLATADPDLPDRPGGDLGTPGDLRVSDEDCQVEELTETTDASGNERLGWKPVYPMGGRIVSIEDRRFPSDKELSTGKIAPDTIGREVPDHRFTLEATWKIEGTKQSGLVHGPASELGNTPKSWPRNREMVIDPAVSMAPKWAANDQWLEAVKMHRRDDIAHLQVWTSMGWVPTGTGVPQFVVGGRAVGPDGICEDIWTDYTGSFGKNADNFGISLPPTQGLGELKEYVRTVLPKAIDLFTNQVWASPAVPAILLAAAFRPVVPMRPRTAVLFTGPPSGGKSYATEMIFSFWQDRPGAFMDAGLPGKASDTAWAMERFVLNSAIWPIDDLAPAANRQKEQNQLDAVEEAIRSVFNGMTKSRGTQAQTIRAGRAPRCLIVVSAENRPGTNSILQRAVHVPVRKNGFFRYGTDRPEFTDRLREWHHETMEGNHLLAASAQMISLAALDSGWPAVMDYWRGKAKEAETIARRAVGGFATEKRAHEVAKDLVLGLLLLEDLGEWAGCDEDLLEQIEVLASDASAHVMAQWSERKEDSQGHRLIEALRGLLVSGKASCATRDSGILPHESDSPYRPFLDQMYEVMGWQEDRGDAERIPKSNSNAPRVGTLVWHGSGEPVIVFDYKAAFQAAKAADSENITSGMKIQETWESVWASGLAFDGWSRKMDGSGNPTTQVRARGVTGVPIPMWRLMLLDHSEIEQNRAA